MNERCGKPNCFDAAVLKQYETTESNRECCPLCKSNFAGRYMLLRHLADCHYRERLCEGLPPGGDSFKCPACNHESKDKGGFVRHYGLVHKMVQKWLKESGLMDDLGEDDGAGGKKTPTSSVADEDSYQLPPVPPGGSGGSATVPAAAAAAAGDFYRQPPASASSMAEYSNPQSQEPFATPFSPNQYGSQQQAQPSPQAGFEAAHMMSPNQSTPPGPVSRQGGGGGDHHLQQQHP